MRLDECNKYIKHGWIFLSNKLRTFIEAPGYALTVTLRQQFLSNKLRTFIEALERP